MVEKIDIQTTSYVLGVLSIVFAFFSPFAGLVLGIIGFTQGKKHGSQRAKRLNLIGIVLSIIFVVISAIALFSLGTGVTDFFPSA